MVPWDSLKLFGELNTTMLAEMEKMNSTFKKYSIWQITQFVRVSNINSVFLLMNQFKLLQRNIILIKLFMALVEFGTLLDEFYFKRL